MTLAINQRAHLVHCLRVAAAQFDANAKELIAQAPLGRTQKRQLRLHSFHAAQAKALADAIEKAHSVEVVAAERS